MTLPTPGTLVARKYQVEALLGEGGMGAVFRARHVLMDKSVALKWLRADISQNEDARARLLREARAISRIDHPNVMQVFDVDSHQGALFLVMEHLEGETFAELIARRTCSTRHVLQLIIGALQGLAAAHDLGIVHRDVKPENLFVVRSREQPGELVKLLDFGISKSAQLEPGSARLTQAGSALGTPLYMPIEQLTHSSEVDGRADLYAVGVVLYHALTGSLPFDGDTLAGVVLRIASGTPVPLRQLRPDLPAALERVVMRAMACRREERFADAGEMIAALRGVEQSLAEPSGQPPGMVPYAGTLTPRPPPGAHDELCFDAQLRGGKRRGAAWFLALTLLAALGALIAWSLGSAPAAISAPAGSGARAIEPERVVPTAASTPSATPGPLDQPALPAPPVSPPRRAPPQGAPPQGARTREPEDRAHRRRPARRSVAREVATPPAPRGREPAHQPAPAVEPTKAQRRAPASGALTRDEF